MGLAFGTSGPTPRIAEPAPAQDERRGNTIGKRGAAAQSGARSAGTASSRRYRAPSASNAAISTLIEGEIIPQLLVAHRLRPERESCPGGCTISAHDLATFAPLPLVLQADELLTHVEALLDRGVGVDAIFVDLLAPTARRLGVLWEEDSCDFLDVTIGLWRLQEVMREIAWGSSQITGPMSGPRRALFAPMPGEQHSFGATMVHEVFGRAGWDSEVLICPEPREIVAKVARRSYDVIGLTISCDASIVPLGDLIKAIRSVSMCPEIQIVVGGHAVNVNPSLAGEVGADGTAPDAPGALALANCLVGVSEHRNVFAG